VSDDPALAEARARNAALEGEVRRLQKDADRQITKLRVLNEIGRSIAAVLDVQRLLELICELVTRNLQCDLSSVMLMEEGGELAMRAARGIPEDIARKIRVKVGHGYAGKAAQTRRSILVRDEDPEASSRGRFSPDDSRSIRYTGGSFAVVPIVHDVAVLGVINVTNKRGGTGIGSDDLEFLETIAASAAVAIENARLHEKAQLLAATDGLTGLYNHRHFQERLAEEVERWRRYWVKGVALVMLDIDHFKRFNDTYGHRAGDAVLREAAHRLRRQARRVDVACRYGGEEFAVILPEVDRAGAAAFAERVRDAFQHEPFNVRDGTAVHLTVSVGAAACPENAADPADLIEAADQALFASKSAGRNRVTVASGFAGDGARAQPGGAPPSGGAGKGEGAPGSGSSGRRITPRPGVGGL
jgi:diguanylate cyclase (GGDEF)-like protein